MAVSVERVTLEEVAGRATELLPRLRERAALTEQLRRIPDDTIQDLRDAGLFKVLQPARYGGYELDYGPTQVALSGILGRACGSTAWVQSVVACHAWCVGMFGQEAQDTVWAGGDDVLIGSAFAPRDGAGERVDGGYVLRGTWQFSSGSAACSWMIIGVAMAGAGPQQRLWCLLHRAQWEPVDTWFAAGLRGSGSGDVHVDEAFVPDAFSLDISQLDGRPSPGSAVNPGYIYRIPLWPTFPYNVTAPALGIARGAIEAFSEQHASRPDRASMPQRQLKVSLSAAEVDAAEALLLSDAAVLKRTSSAGQIPDARFVAKLKRDLSFAVMMCSQAVERLATSVGAHGIEEGNPVNRASRDMHGIANHAANSWDTAGLAFGQVSFGLG